jgi:hypothetical protein
MARNIACDSKPINLHATAGERSRTRVHVLPDFEQTWKFAFPHRFRATMHGQKNKGASMKFSTALLLSLFAVGCATSTVESRKKERLTSYNALPPDQKQLVDLGQIKVGMSADAVYIAWGPPSDILESEDEHGHWTTWVFHGQVMEESRYWTYREIARDGTRFLERYLESDYFPRSYVRAEISFQNGAVKNWRTLPRPVQ